MDQSVSRDHTADESHDVDVVVVGASLAGCTTARLAAQAGLRVALIERHGDPAHYKRLCTHYIQASARPTLQRLGLDGALERAGAVRNSARIWTRWGWIDPPAGDHFGYSVRREILDPLLRELTLRTPGVEGLLGWTVRGLVTSRSGRVVGVEAQAGDGRRTSITGRMVVGADGARSSVAALAGVDERKLPNGRFFYWAQYRDLPRPERGQALMWLLEPDAAYLFPNDDDVTLVSVAPSKAWLPEFDRDRGHAFERFVRGLPDGPDLDGAERISPLLGTRDHPLRHRPAAPRPGLVLVGDAATTSDPLWGVGCGWALQSAEWLVDAIAQPLLAGGAGLAAGVRAYRRARRHLDRHERLLADSARVRELNPLERAWFAAAAEDGVTARRLDRFATRELPATTLLSPTLVRRITALNRATRARAGAAPAWAPATNVERREVIVGGHRSALLEAGADDGVEALVCLPGPLGSSEDFGHLVAGASRLLRAVTVDLPGTDLAGRRRPTSAHDLAAQLGRIIDRLGVRRTHLVLHDAAAWWGLRWVADCPGRVASVTLVGGGLPVGGRRLGPGRAGQRPRRDGGALTAAARLHRLPAERGMRPLPTSYLRRLTRGLDAEHRRTLLALYRSGEQLAHDLAATPDRLCSVDLPIHVIWGRHDRRLPLSEAYRQRNVFPRAEVSVLDHSGHRPFVDDPERFVEIALSFLARHTGDAPANVVG